MRERCPGRHGARFVAHMALDITPEEERELPMRTRRKAAETAWVLLFLDGLLLGGTSMFWIAWGRFFDTGVYQAISAGTWPTAAALAPSVERVAGVGVRLAGFLGAMASLFVIAVSVTSFRRGERWAWYLMWMLPCFATLDISDCSPDTAPSLRHRSRGTRPSSGSRSSASLFLPPLLRGSSARGTRRHRRARGDGCHARGERPRRPSQSQGSAAHRRAQHVPRGM